MMKSKIKEGILNGIWLLMGIGELYIINTYVDSNVDQRLVFWLSNNLSLIFWLLFIPILWLIPHFIFYYGLHPLLFSLKKWFREKHTPIINDEAIRRAVAQLESNKQQVQNFTIPPKPQAQQIKKDIETNKTNNLKTAQALNDKVVSLSQQNKYMEAILTAKESLKFAEENLGKNHLQVAQLLNSLAMAYEMSDRYKEAEPIYKRALGILEENLGMNDPSVVTTKKNIETLQNKIRQKVIIKNEGQIMKCPKCKIDTYKSIGGENICPQCGLRYTDEQNKQQVQDFTVQSKPQAQQTKVENIEYFDDILPTSDYCECSDDSCPCSPSTPLPRGTGFLYVSKEAVAMRSDARTIPELQAKCERIVRQKGGNAFMFFTKPTVTGVLVCERGARLRNLDLEIAAADARQWWRTGKVPLRPTPILSINASHHTSNADASKTLKSLHDEKAQKQNVMEAKKEQQRERTPSVLWAPTPVDDFLKSVSDKLGNLTSVDPLNIKLYFNDLQASWGCTILKQCSADEILSILRINLERDKCIENYANFSFDADVKTFSCADVASSFYSEKGFNFATVYRIWRHEDIFYICGSKDFIAPTNIGKDAGGINKEDVNDVSLMKNYIELLSVTKFIPSTIKQMIMVDINLINLVNDKERTALHLANRIENKELIEFLISYGANTNLKDKYGFIPEDYQLFTIETDDVTIFFNSVINTLLTKMPLTSPTDAKIQFDKRSPSDESHDACCGSMKDISNFLLRHLTIDKQSNFDHPYQKFYKFSARLASDYAGHSDDNSIRLCSVFEGYKGQGKRGGGFVSVYDIWRTEDTFFAVANMLTPRLTNLITEE